MTGKNFSLPGKTLVIGAESFLGKQMLKAYQVFYPGTLGTHYKSLNPRLCIDLLRPNLSRLELTSGEYTHAFIAAANTKLALCEEEKNMPFRRNVEGVLELVKQLVALNIQPILFSSDYVFDGVTGEYTEESATCPVNEYGRQKEEMERGIRKICGDNYLLLRCSKVFGLELGDGTLVDQIVSPLIRNEPVKAAYDQIFSPIYIQDVVDAVICLQALSAKGLFNLCGKEVWSRLDLAKTIAKTLLIDEKLVEEISLSDLKRPYKLPKRTNMNCNRFYTYTGMQLTPLSSCIESLKKYALTTRFR
ncbi:MAG: sugar nucleotide-binding protein [Chlamydiales bacterium]|nr:sugar nucleotide-binding protein [Chlamydiales bacterium]